MVSMIDVSRPSDVLNAGFGGVIDGAGVGTLPLLSGPLSLFDTLSAAIFMCCFFSLFLRLFSMNYFKFNVQNRAITLDFLLLLFSISINKYCQSRTHVNRIPRLIYFKHLM